MEDSPMEHKSWLDQIIALGLFIACVLGCTKLRADIPKTEPADNNHSTVEQTTITPADISGAYSVSGTNQDGSPYKGALEVIKRGEVYQFRWNAGRVYDGVGIPNGNVVAVAFTEGKDGKGCGVVNYRMLSGSTLDGKWGYWGLNESGLERGTRTSGADLAGTYNTTGQNPDGGQYKGTMTIAPRAGGYMFEWSNGATGFGVTQGSNISVGIGGPLCAFVAYEIKSGGMLDGIWGVSGSDKTGTEKATKK
jgi:hypothetical protein